MCVCVCVCVLVYVYACVCVCVCVWHSLQQPTLPKQIQGHLTVGIQVNIKFHSWLIFVFATKYF